MWSDKDELTKLMNENDYSSENARLRKENAEKDEYIKGLEAHIHAIERVQYTEFRSFAVDDKYKKMFSNTVMLPIGADEDYIEIAVQRCKEEFAREIAKNLDYAIDISRGEYEMRIMVKAAI